MITPRTFFLALAPLAPLVLACGGRAIAPPVQTSSAAASSPFDSTPPEPSIAITADMGSPHVGGAAPDFELADQTGAKVKLSSLRGKVVMLAFVTSWCPFSEAEQPNLAKLAADYANDPRVRVLSIDIKEGEEGYRKYLGRAKTPFPVLRDPTGAVTATFTPAGAQPNIKDRATVLVTSNVVIDPEGVIRFFTMVDTVHFDSRLVHARRAIEGLLAQASSR
jgi:peroxiredoxin